MKIVVEISGGADSCLATLLAKEKYQPEQIYGLFVNYGQANYKYEKSSASKFCKKFNISLKEIKIDNLFTKGTINGENKADSKGVASVYTPFRNGVILACSISYAESVDADVVIVGSKGLNLDGKPYSFRDSVLPFYTLMNAVSTFGTYNGVKVDPILMSGRNEKMSKLKVYEELQKRGVQPDDTWSCFNNGSAKCKCNNCIEKREIKKIIN